MLKVELWPIERLVPYIRNPRKNDEQVDRMASAIREFGFRIPVVAKSDGSVVDGHLRLKAAQKLGLKDVPVALADELTDAQVKAFRLLANQSANWAEWDTELLKLELEDLRELDYDLALTGFEPGELAELTGELDTDGEGGEAAEKTTLADRYMFAPFSVLSAREGGWQARKKEWLDIGIQSELGRGGIHNEGVIPGGGSPMPLDRTKNLASPGGSPRPACDYSKNRARGDGRGRAIQ